MTPLLQRNAIIVSSGKLNGKQSINCESFSKLIRVTRFYRLSNKKAVLSQGIRAMPL